MYESDGRDTEPAVIASVARMPISDSGNVATYTKVVSIERFGRPLSFRVTRQKVFLKGKLKSATY